MLKVLCLAAVVTLIIGPNSNIFANLFWVWVFVSAFDYTSSEVKK